MTADSIIKQLNKTRESLRKAVDNHTAVLETYKERLAHVESDLKYVQEHGKLPGCEGCDKNKEAQG